MRSRTRPSERLATPHTYMALTTCPRWRKPVGAGANRDIMRAMIQGRTAFIVSVVVAGFAIAASTTHVIGQDKARTKPGESATYGGDLASTRYSPLDQIDRTNFNKLEVAWHFKTDALGPRPEFNFQSTPLMADGIVYSTAGSRRDV